MTLYSLDLFSLFIYAACYRYVCNWSGVFMQWLFIITPRRLLSSGSLLLVSSAKAQPKTHAMPCYACFDSGTNTCTLMHMQAHLPGLGAWTARSAPPHTM